MMRLALNQCREMAYLEQGNPLEKKKGYTILRVSYCAVCRTDAKMWNQGHRDLVLPRVLGHEICGIEETTSQVYTLWPGQSCGRCRYCNSNRENLCEEMRIIGFHSDGGFAAYVSVPDTSLIAVQAEVEPHLLTFAEPVACVLNGLDRLGTSINDRALIYGAGVMGMITALILQDRGCRTTVIEKSQEKIARLQQFADRNGIKLVKDTNDADFDLAINCCDSHIAFILCITKLRKGGKLSFFSGLEKNEELETNLLNLIHYKELDLFGAYGPRKDHMDMAVPILARHQASLEMLIERIIRPREVESVLPLILSGKALKFIVDLSGDQDSTKRREKLPYDKQIQTRNHESSLPAFLQDLLRKIQPVSKDFHSRAQKKVDLKTKPLGALGRIEWLAVKMAVIQHNLNPVIDSKRMFVFAGDHGVVEEGVSAFPAKVTVQMVENFLDGGAAINAFCGQYGIELTIVDMGVKGNFADHPLLINKKVARGTRNFAIQPAMSRKEAALAIKNGATAFEDKYKQQRCELVGMGEMGIGNSSSAAAIICAATGLSVKQIVGRGTGVDDQGLARKREVLEKALALHQPEPENSLDLLAKIGGYELGGICGAVLAAASEKCCIVLDGIISTAAGLLACLICPEVKDYLVAGHRSVETGQLAALDLMDLEPVLDLDMRLGEGTGAAITMNLAELSCTMMRDMASFDEAGVDSSTSSKTATIRACQAPF